MLHPEDWGRGLATEIVSAALDRAFGEHRLPWVGAFARPENGASIRVLEKSGFRWVRHVPELERNQYRIDEEAFRACRD
jgi:RimJ/RimL family protein N-acetyltransferase